MDFDAIREARIPVLYLEPEHLRCIVSEFRRDLLFLIARIGPCSISEMAQHDKTYPEAYYHHVRKLLAAGLIREVAARRKGAREEAVYDASATDYRIKPQPWEPAYAQSCLKMFQSEFRVVAAQNSSAILKFGTAPAPDALVAGRKIQCEMNEAKIAEFKERLSDLHAWLAQDPEGHDTRTHTIFISVFPNDS